MKTSSCQHSSDPIKYCCTSSYMYQMIRCISRAGLFGSISGWVWARTSRPVYNSDLYDCLCYSTSAVIELFSVVSKYFVMQEPPN